MWLPGVQRQALDFWSTTIYYNKPLLITDIMEAATLRNPCLAHHHDQGASRTGLFFELTEATFQNVLLQDCLDGGTANANCTMWANRHAGVLPAVRKVALYIPVPFGVLLLSKRWPCYCFPIPGGRGNGRMKLHLAKSLWAGVDMKHCLPSSEPFVFEPQLLQDLSDLLRRGATSLGDREERSFFIEWLQAARNSFFAQTVSKTRRMFDLSFLIQAMLTAAKLSDAGCLKEVLLRCISTAVPEVGMRDYLKRHFESSHSLPCRTVLFHHRLTLHLGFCRWLSEINAALLSNPGGLIRWSTVDSSPCVGYDWVLHGSATMKCQDSTNKLTNQQTCVGRLVSTSQQANAQTSKPATNKQTNQQTSQQPFVARTYQWPLRQQYNFKLHNILMRLNAS